MAPTYPQPWNDKDKIMQWKVNCKFIPLSELDEVNKENFLVT